jgi:hypothetical protein
MPLRETLQRISTEYPAAKGLPLEGHALAGFIRHQAAQTLEEGLGELGAGLVVEGSPGQGNWAAVPWISVFDPAITTSATRGYYVVYLFHASEPVTCICPSIRAPPSCAKNSAPARVKYSKTELI